ncbi:MAG: septum site-determining protein MinC [Gammaproteobacteria bacterium]|nr:septum site-determining protein MinC [Gammaproteobacteria bacterium]
MAESTTVMERQSCFQFKTSFSPCTIMQVTRYDLDEIARQLDTTIQKAPNFFIGSAVILDLEGVKTQTNIDLAAIKKILLANNMVPVGVRGGNDLQHQEAAGVGMPTIAIGAKATSTPQAAPTADAPSPAESNKKPRETALQSNTKIITTPIRSGMQIYAKDGDLIVLSSVSPGAELLADGNIHVYGALRGRALAGVQGNTQARIFCRTLEAELVAIAGYYLVKEDIQELPSQDSSVQVYLDNEQVKIAAL